MNRQQDVVKAFNFLIELLKDPTDEVTEKEVDTLKDVEKPATFKTTSKDKVKPDTRGVLDLMRKMDKIDKRRTPFDEPLQRKALAPELRDGTEEASAGVHLSMAPVINTKTGEVAFKPTIEIVKD